MYDRGGYGQALPTVRVVEMKVLTSRGLLREAKKCPRNETEIVRGVMLPGVGRHSALITSCSTQWSSSYLFWFVNLSMVGSCHSSMSTIRLADGGVGCGIAVGHLSRF